MSTNPVPATDGALDAAVWAGLQVFSTCPSSHVTPDRYRERVIAAARWSEQAGCTGTLIYTDNTLVDPWMVAQIVITNTSNLCPLVAVQPVYMHPYSAAKMVATLAFLYGRRVFLNMVAGGFKNDLAALNDDTPHDSRYERLIEYTTIIRRLLEQRSVSFEGRFYQVRGLSLNPRVPPGLLPGVLVSGSSEAGMAAAREMGAIAVKYPEPPAECAAAPRASAVPCGVRIGIVARPGEPPMSGFRRTARAGSRASSPRKFPIPPGTSGSRRSAGRPGEPTGCIPSKPIKPIAPIWSAAMKRSLNNCGDICPTDI